MNARIFLKAVRAATPIRPAHLRKLEAYSSKPYRQGVSDLPKWVGKDKNGLPIKAGIEIGAEETLWWIERTDGWCVVFGQRTGELTVITRPNAE